MRFEDRAAIAKHPVAQQLLLTMAQKKSNLCLSADVTTSQALLDLIEMTAEQICLLKTHIDIIEDFTPDLTDKLQELAKKHQFLIFEDRKFADIGHTCAMQYAKGIYHIVQWAHIVNAHILPGPGIIEGLKKVGLPKKRGLLLLAEMSSSGALTDGNYAQTALDMAHANEDFVIGFIASRKLSNHAGILHLTPGVQLEEGEDALGQRYNTPENAIEKRESDLIIVGRGITAAKSPENAANKYRESAWQAYENRCYHS